MNYYVLKEGEKGAPLPIDLDDAPKFNRTGYGVYWTYNAFRGFGKRLKEDLTAIRAFFIETDKVEKSVLRERIARHLPPSLVIETYRGYHLYWILKKPIDTRANPVGHADAYRRFLLERLLPVFEADPQAADACRLLRVPFYKYWKVPEAEFFIDIAIEDPEARYTVEELKEAFPVVASTEAELPGKQESLFRSEYKHKDDFWVRASNLNSREALKRLSGTVHVNRERFDFRPEKSGHRILVNKKPCNAWIDREGRIGSMAGGGPTVVNWLFYYHKSYARVAEILKEVFPELSAEPRRQVS